MKRILCFGDSNTFGYDPRSYFGRRYPKSVRWTGRLEAEGWEVLNYGQNGMEIPTSEGDISLCEKIAKKELPDAVIIMLGSNDLLQYPDMTAEQTALRMEKFLSRLIENARTACFLLVSPPPMQAGEWVSEQRLFTQSARIGDCYQAVAERLHIAFLNAGEWGIDLAFDGVHFLPSGHSAFADGIDTALTNLSQPLKKHR